MVTAPISMEPLPGQLKIDLFLQRQMVRFAPPLTAVGFEKLQGVQ